MSLSNSIVKSLELRKAKFIKPFYINGNSYPTILRSIKLGACSTQLRRFAYQIFCEIE